MRLDEVILPKGSAATYEYVEIKHGSTTLAVEDNLDVWLVREWKYAINRYSLEVPSGGIETNEEPLSAAKRELREEAVHGFRTAQEPDQRVDEPGILACVAERGEPHLPIEPWLVRLHPGQGPVQGAGLVVEQIRFPFLTVC